MSPLETLAAARRDFAAGRLPRADYWRVAAECYLELRERTPLESGGPIKAISSDAGALVAEMRDGIRMVWDPRDVRTVPNWMLNHGDYERTEKAALAALAEDASVVFDVGANVGWYTVNIARQIAPRGGRVYAFEPIPRTHATLEKNVALNKLNAAVSLSRLGLGDTPGETTFYVPAATGSVAASQRQLFENEANEKVTARIVRLDDVVAELGVKRLDLIKCDIEGGELLMLRGGGDTIRRFRPMLFLELLRKWSKAYGYHPDDVIGLLAREGYRCWAITDAGLEAMTSMQEDCVHTNFLFMHESHEKTRLTVDAKLRALAS